MDEIFGDLLDPLKQYQLHLLAVDGVHHGNKREPLDPLPGRPLQLLLTTAGNIPYTAACCSYTVDGTDPANPSANSQSLNPIGSYWDDQLWGIVRTWGITLPPFPEKTLLRYQLSARRSDQGKWIAADNGASCSLWIDNDSPPAWAREARVYQIFPDRFYPGTASQWKSPPDLSGIYGGTLGGVMEKLEYIQDLGFNTIWLTPFFKTNSHHGYNASDYYQVEPRLGTQADLRALIDKAHSLNIRMILDFVANHWSKDHFTFQDAIQNAESPYRSWYFWKQWPTDYDCYFDVRELPKVNLENPAARAYMLDVARFWLREGFDGYRLDFAYGPSHDFWVNFRRACREVNPEAWLFGEVIHTGEMLRSYTGIMDGTLDFHLTNAIRKTFAQMTMSLGDFEAFLAAHENYFPSEHIRPSFLDNHDEARFLYLSNNDKALLKLAALIQYGLVGPPIVYAGTETGLTQERPMLQNGHNVFEECRLPMNWESADRSLMEYYNKLNTLRASHPVLITGYRRLVLLDSEAGIYSFFRENAEERVLIAINLGEDPRQISVPNPGYQSPVDVLNYHPLKKDGESLIIDLPPKSGAFICERA